jgi:hypothetical protein
MIWQNFKQRYLVRFWPPVPAVIAAGVLSAYYFGLTGRHAAAKAVNRRVQHGASSLKKKLTPFMG